MTVLVDTLLENGQLTVVRSGLVNSQTNESVEKG
jgi:hypothetical protein